MRTIAAALLILALAPDRAAAQTRLARLDISGTLGWFSANTSDVGVYDGWANRSLIGEAGAGVYWTSHWKTEFLVAATTAADVYGATSVIINGEPFYSPLHLRFSTRRVEITHQYQFGDNQWFHPYVGAGVDGVWEKSRRRNEPIYFYDQALRQSRLIRPAVDDPDRIELRAVPALAAGFKSYLTTRGFFRSDLRVTFDGRPDEVILRFGFGVDF
jgi:hypothetical protein